MKSLKEEFGINLFRIAMYTEENGYIHNKSLKNKVEEIVENAKKLIEKIDSGELITDEDIAYQNQLVSQAG
jgi:hypothetical protein